MKQNEITCDIIADLLPLYNEELCSEDSRALVEEHLRTCEDCRRLCEEMTLPTVEKTNAPDETEAFKKVNRGLRRSRFTKVMAILFCVLLVLFGIWNAVWYFLKYRPYNDLAENMPVVENAEGAKIYNDSDGKNTYDVYVPGYLDLASGFIRVTNDKNSSTLIDTNGSIMYEANNYATLFIWLKVEGKTKYGVDIRDGDVFYQIYIDEELDQIPYDDQTDEQTEIYQKLLDEHRDEIQDLMDAAHNMWGDKLK